MTTVNNKTLSASSTHKPKTKNVRKAVFFCNIDVSLEKTKKKYYSCSSSWVVNYLRHNKSFIFFINLFQIHIFLFSVVLLMTVKKH